MNEVPASRLCLFCEQAPATTWYGLCEACNQVKARRRVYRRGHGRKPEWEAHLQYLTERAKQRLPLFEDGRVPPPRPRRGRRKKRGAGRVPKVFRLTLPRKELDE
jgi:hypothetical protein